MHAQQRLPRWVFLWLAISTVVVVWDALFVLLRPNSFPGGDIGFLWSFAYTTYLEVDHSYADLSNHVIEAMAIMSLVEACLVAVALTWDKQGASKKAHLLAMIAAALTCAKTMLFFLVEGMHDWHSIAHNDILSMMAFYIIPNGLWILVPLLVVLTLGKTVLTPPTPHLKQS